ncbi:MAG: hypothetical protein RLP13_16030 [Cytophagales bacterium]
MNKTSIIPLYHLNGTGNTTIDVVLNDGEFFIRLIDYRNKKEFLTKVVPSNSDLYGKSIKRHIERGLDYCRTVSRLLNVDDLTGDQQKLLKVLPYGQAMKEKDLAQKLDISPDVLQNISKPLVEKRILNILRYNEFHHADPWRELRIAFDTAKNKEFLR